MIKNLFLRRELRADLSKRNRIILRRRADRFVELVVTHFPGKDPPYHRAFVGDLGIIIVIKRRNNCERSISARDRRVRDALTLSLDISDVLSKTVLQELSGDVLRQSFAYNAASVAGKSDRVTEPDLCDRIRDRHRRKRV